MKLICAFAVLVAITSGITEWIGIISSIVLAVVGLIGIVVAICTLAVIRRQTDATEKAANAAELNAQALISSERAWVLVEIGTLPDFKPDPNRVQILWIMPTITNGGKTTARIMKIFARQQAIAKGENLPPEPEYQGQQNIDFILPPNKPIQTVGVGISGEDYIRARDGASVLYIYGFIDYLDIGETERQTRFCFIFRIPSGFDPLPIGFYPAVNAPAAYTKAT
jgi:hypothetical protein